MSGSQTVLDALDHEWSTLVDAAHLRAALQRWGAEDPVLAFDSAGALVARVEERDRPADADAILAALVRRAVDDQTAARLLLQLLLPGLKRLVWIFGGQDREDTASFVVAAAWDRIRCYPVDRRPRAIAANVILDVRQRVVRHLQRRRRHTPLHRVREESLPRVSPAPDPYTRTLDHLQAAVRAGTVDAASARLIVETRVLGVPVADIARRERAKEQTLRRRRARAERRLRDLVSA